MLNWFLFHTTDSWYVGANIPGKPRVILPYAGGPGAYRVKCEEMSETLDLPKVAAKRGTAIHAADVWYISGPTRSSARPVLLRPRV